MESSNTKTKRTIRIPKYWRPISLLCTDYKILTKEQTVKNKLYQI